ncbi:MAG: tetratricopeptide repeat protein [Candidatus Eisenbacteria bacterium]|nr:tetratricopeptide repeat protein [Candidatus Eisenbacteria bacterium]
MRGASVGTERGPMKNRVYLFLALIALVPRVFFFIESAGAPLSQYPYLDAASYDEWARKVAGGECIGERAFHMAPLYPYLLGALYRIAGRNLSAVHAAQHILGILNLLLVFAIANRLFGRRTAWLAFLLALGYGPLLYFEGQILASTLGVTFGLLSLYLFIRAFGAGGKGLFTAGLVLGIGSVARPNLIFFVPLVLIWALFGERVGLRRTAAALAGVLIALIPPVAHNYYVEKDFIPISSHGGISFYLGNGPYTQGTYAPPPEFGGNPEAIDIIDSRRLAEEAAGRPLKASEISNYWYGKSFEFMRENPLRYTRLLLRKIALYVNAHEIPLDVNYDFDRRLYRTLRWSPFPIGVLFPLAFLGGLLLIRRGGRGNLLVLFLLANAASVIAFFICARYRQTAMPAAAILAAFAVIRLFETARAGRWRSLAALVALLLLFGAVVHLDLYTGRQTGDARSAVVLGRAYASAGDEGEAEKAFREAVRIVPGYADGWMNLGLLLYRGKRFDEAAEAFGEATRAAPGFAGAWNNLGNALREGGETERAASAIAEATRRDPGYAGAWSNLAITLERLGRYKEAEAAHRRAIEADPRTLHWRANLAGFLFERGRLEEAKTVSEDAARALPDDPGAAVLAEKVRFAAERYLLARERSAAGDREGALRALAEAVRAGGEGALRLAESDPAFAPLREERGDTGGGEGR